MPHTPDELQVHFVIDGQAPGEVRTGETLDLIIHGAAACASGPIRAIELAVAESRSGPQSFQGFPRANLLLQLPSEISAAERLFSGFAARWSGRFERPGDYVIALRFAVATAEGEKWSSPALIGGFPVAPRLVRKLRSYAPAVEIAMATYEPDPELFVRQIASIRAQTVEDWRLVISDESPSEAGQALVREQAALDQRIVARHGERLGFLGNFERAARQLDLRSSYFAFADQDDFWHPNKLETLVETLRTSDASLVYGDMRLVDRAGSELAPSFWSWRQPHGDSVAELLIANTVSGAAMLGRTELLRRALPFPHFPGVFHDMWLALLAAQIGKVVYVPQVLQDYVQHERNVIGHDAGRLDQYSVLNLTLQTRALREAAKLLPEAVQNGDRAALDSLWSRVLSALSDMWPELVRRGLLRDAMLRRAEAERQDSPLGLAQLGATLDPAVPGGALQRYLGLPWWLDAGLAMLQQLADDPALRAALAERAEAFAKAPEGDAPPVVVCEVSGFDCTILIDGLAKKFAPEPNWAALELGQALEAKGWSVRLAMANQPLTEFGALAEIMLDRPDLADFLAKVAVEEWAAPGRTIRLGKGETIIASGQSALALAARLDGEYRLVSLVRSKVDASLTPHQALFTSGELAEKLREAQGDIFAPQASTWDAALFVHAADDGGWEAAADWVLALSGRA